MRTLLFSLAGCLCASGALYAQHAATITITDLGTGLPMENASVYLDGNTVATDANGMAVFPGLPDNTYDFSVTEPCHLSGGGTVVINGADAEATLEMAAMITNNLFWYIGDPFAITGATVQVSNGAGYDTSFVTWDTFGGEMLADVPFGAISYTISAPCFETVSGTVTVDCNGGNGIMVIADPAQIGTNNLFWYIGDPFAITGATVQVSNGAGYDTSFVTWDTFGGEMLADVPFGAISYTISAPCFETVSGTVTVDCNGGNGIMVIADPAEIGTNNLFWYIGDPFAITGATVQVSNGAGYDTTFVTWDTFGGEMLADVPFGAISYIISAPCFETVSGTVTVDCNGGNGIMVIADPAEIVLDLGVTASGETLTASASGVQYQWVDCNNGNTPIAGATGQSYTATTSGSYAVTITNGDCSQTAECTAVVVTDVAEAAALADLSIFPSPFSDQLAVRLAGVSGTVQVRLFDLAGQLMAEEIHTDGTITLRTEKLAPGSYLLRVAAGEVQRTWPVVKQ
jgi:hypothetical protein